MHGLIRTAESCPVRLSRLVSLILPAAAAILASACSSAYEPASPARPWRIADFQLLSDGSANCPGHLGPALGILASTDCAMPENSLKLAAGCRAAGGGAEFGAVVELRVKDSLGRLESFESLDLVTAGTGDNADMAWGLAAFRAIRHAAAVWGVTRATDLSLCEMIEDDGTKRDILMRALEEVAVRKKCRAEVESLAASRDEDVALRAIGALGRIGASQSIETLGRLTLSRHPGVPWAATHAIADIGGPDAVRALEIVSAQADTVELRVEAERLAAGIRAWNR